MADHSSLRMPGATARDIALGRMPNDPTSLLHESLYPEDAFHGQTYWADLPRKEQAKWISEQSNAEAAREFGQVWQIFKTDPLRPFSLYFHNYAVTGLGFFTEGYTLFSVGNILSLFESVWPACYKEYKVCNEVWVQSIDYLEIVGILLGQITVGFIGIIGLTYHDLLNLIRLAGDWIGRRWGIIQDAVVMFIGSILLTAMWGKSLYGWTIMYAWSLLWFGIGVGGGKSRLSALISRAALLNQDCFLRLQSTL